MERWETYRIKVTHTAQTRPDPELLTAQELLSKFMTHAKVVTTHLLVTFDSSPNPVLIPCDYLHECYATTPFLPVPHGRVLLWTKLGVVSHQIPQH